MSKKGKNKKNRIVSLRFKSVAVVLIATIVLASIGAIISYNVYSNTMDAHYKLLATNLAKTAATQLDTDAILHYYSEIKKIGDFDNEKYNNDEKYRAEYDKKADKIKDEKYDEMLNTLFDIKNSFDENDDGIKYLYVQKIDGNITTYIFDADNTEDQYQLGTVREISGAAKKTAHPEEGVDPFISYDEDDGWLASSLVPVRDENGKPVALVGIDIDMDKIMADRTNYLKNIIATLSIAVIILCLIIMIIVNKGLVNPINRLSNATSRFVENRSEDADKASELSKLKIQTGDEVETLCDSIKQMERDINEYITNLTAVTAEKERIGAELGLATRIQADMLPNIFPAFPERSDFDIYASMTPAKEVGGDFYDFFLIDDTHLAMIMADVSGKGVPAALFMMMSKILLQNAVLSGMSPAEALMAVNNQICANNREEMFVTVWLGIADLRNRKLIAANAGHEKPILKMPNGKFELYSDKHGFVVGGMEGLRYRDYEMPLEKGTKIFLYTDGVAEATNANDELYGIERTLEALNTCKDEDPKTILKEVKKNVDEFVGDAPQFDDLTMLCFEFKGFEGGDNDSLTLSATLDNVEVATDYVAEKISGLPFSEKVKNQISIAVDEIVSNVARYAYKEENTGEVIIEFDSDDKGVSITVCDNGIPYNPLEKDDPDVTLSAEERGIGGYGIFIVKKTMDNVSYENKDGSNVLTMRKNYN